MHSAILCTGREGSGWTLERGAGSSMPPLGRTVLQWGLWKMKEKQEVLCLEIFQLLCPWFNPAREMDQKQHWGELLDSFNQWRALSKGSSSVLECSPLVPHHSDITKIFLVLTFNRNGHFFGEKPEADAKPRHLVYFPMSKHQ